MRPVHPSPTRASAAASPDPDELSSYLERQKKLTQRLAEETRRLAEESRVASAQFQDARSRMELAVATVRGRLAAIKAGLPPDAPAPD